VLIIIIIIIIIIILHYHNHNFPSSSLSYHLRFGALLGYNLLLSHRIVGVIIVRLIRCVVFLLRLLLHSSSVLMLWGRKFYILVFLLRQSLILLIRSVVIMPRSR